jgi:hypothetical protein
MCYSLIYIDIHRSARHTHTHTSSPRNTLAPSSPTLSVPHAAHTATPTSVKEWIHTNLAAASPQANKPHAQPDKCSEVTYIHMHRSWTAIASIMAAGRHKAPRFRDIVRGGPRNIHTSAWQATLRRLCDDRLRSERGICAREQSREHILRAGGPAARAP